MIPLRLAVLPAFLGLALLAGCGGTKTAVSEATARQSLLRGAGEDISTLDPHLCTDTNQRDILSALFEGLVIEDPVDLHPIPGVAESWNVEEGGRVYTFHLRANATWSNGTPVTASDFVASFRRLLSRELGAENASLAFVIQGATAFHAGTSNDLGIEALDPRTLRITLDHPSPTFLSVLTHAAFYPVNVAAITKVGAVNSRLTSWSRVESFVGNGAFVLTSWKAGQELVVTKSSTYWDAAVVKLQDIHFRFMPDRDTEERSFRAGQLHLTEALPPSRIDAWKRDQPSKLRIDDYLGTEFYRLNLSRPFVNDARVRRALALAIDRAQLTQKLLRGGQAPAGSLVPYSLAHYKPDGLLAYEPDEARRLLAEAGFPGGSGAPIVEILFNTSESHRALAEAVQQMWKKELGLNVRLVNQERTVTLAARRTGDFQVLRSVWISDYLDPLSFLQIMTTGDGNNFTGWSNASYDDAVQRAGKAATPEQREALLRRAEEILIGDVPVIPLYHYAHVFLIDPAVKHWYPTLLDHHPYKFVSLEKP